MFVHGEKMCLSRPSASASVLRRGAAEARTEKSNNSATTATTPVISPDVPSLFPPFPSHPPPLDLVTRSSWGILCSSQRRLAESTAPRAAGVFVRREGAGGGGRC